MALHLPSLNAERLIGRPCPKGESRLQRATVARKVETVTDTQFKADVWRLDAGHCRKCGGRVKKSLTRHHRRGEVHHVHGRLGALRHDVRGSCLVCQACHEQLTGKVAEKWIIVPTTGSTYFTVLEKGTPRELLNVRGPIKFERVA